MPSRTFKSRARPGAPWAWGVLLVCAGAAGCTAASDPAPPGATVVEVWYHAGQAGERATVERQARRFNALQDSVYVRVAFLPEGSYNAQVQASAVAGTLPDLLDLDGPNLATYAWQGHLRPLDGLLPDSVVADLLPSVRAQGAWQGTLYGVGTFDSGLVLYGDGPALRAAGARIPEGPEDAWTAEEMTDVLDRLARADEDGAVLDLKLNYEGEWYTYAFQPALRSAGGGLLDTSMPRPLASGTLNSPASASALGTLGRWMTSGLVDPNLDDVAFTTRRVALSWSGHWDAARYEEALGEDLLVLPLPDFGRGTRTGQGSWLWTIPRSSPKPEAAATFLAFLLEPAQVLEMAEANGAVPGTRTAAQASDRYGEGGTLHLVLRQLEGGFAVPRPRTPAYPFASSIFQDAFDDIRNGEPAGTVLDRAARAIDAEIADNHGYALP